MYVQQYYSIRTLVDVASDVSELALAVAPRHLVLALVHLSVLVVGAALAVLVAVLEFANVLILFFVNQSA
jgi:hypothetical protein